MPKKEPAAGAAIAVSPSLSLREAVRPLIFAHALLTREQDLAGELAKECRKLEQLTRKALEAAALVHLLAPDTVADDTDTSRQDRVIGAYAKAATSWAEVTGTAIALADALLDAGRPDDVYRLAGFLEAAGEPAAAQDLSARADAVVKRSLEARLGRIHDIMTEPEITAAIEALRECRDGAAVSFYLPDLARSIARILPASREETYKISVKGIITKWHTTPRNIISAQGIIVTIDPLTNRAFNIPAGVPMIISKLLIPEGQTVTDDTTEIFSFIRIPAALQLGLGMQQPGGSKVSARVDAIAREFRQIQAENARSGGVDEQ